MVPGQPSMAWGYFRAILGVRIIYLFIYLFIYIRIYIIWNMDA
jgi:hypothetical protein